MKCKIGIIIVATLLFVSTIGCSSNTTTATSTSSTPVSSLTTTTVSQITSPTTTTFDNINTASSTSANGLSFSVSTDLTIYQPGQGVDVVVDERNTLSKTNNVSASDNWPVDGLTRMYFGPVTYPNIPYGISVYQGDYTSANFSALLTPLYLYDPTSNYLATTVNAPTSYAFEPSSDIANIITNNSIPNADAGTDIQQISISTIAMPK
jgi:hypothetical protein